MDSNKINQGQQAVKKLEAGVHTNLELLRKALNVICEENNFTIPDELKQLNDLFN